MGARGECRDHEPEADWGAVSCSLFFAVYLFFQVFFSSFFSISVFYWLRTLQFRERTVFAAGFDFFFIGLRIFWGREERGVFFFFWWCARCAAGAVPLETRFARVSF
jgi:hypothetical protein